LVGGASFFAVPASFLPVLPWLVLLLVYLPLDLVQGVGEQMVLRPPEAKPH
jgi:hypothetical protein